MSTPSLYNANPDLVEMKEDIAKRSFRVTLKTMLITGAAVAVGALLGMAVLPVLLPAMASSAVMAGYLGGAAGLLLGGHVATLATTKERQRLKIDEQYVESYNQGKNHWGSGYRQEVAEYGYSLAGPVSGLPPTAKNMAQDR